MRGHIAKKGKRWYYIVDLPKGADGKRKQKWSSGFIKKKNAEKALAAVISEIEKGTYIETRKITLGEYLNSWFKNYEQRLAPTSSYGYQLNIEKHIIPRIGQIKLQKLNAMHIDNFYAELLESGRVDGKGGLSAKSVIYIHRVLRKALQDAYAKELVYRNVADFATVPKEKGFNPIALNDNEVKNLLIVFKDTDFFIPVLLAVAHGLRRGEVLGLRWHDVDFNRYTISVNQSIVHSKNGLIFKEPKSKQSRRTLKTTIEMIDLLKKHKEAIQDSNINKDNYVDNGLIICNPDGSPIYPTCFSNKFSTLLEKKGYKKLRFHDLRHTYATLLMKMQTPMKVVSALMGHSSIGMTSKYSHVTPEMLSEYPAELKELVFN